METTGIAQRFRGYLPVVVDVETAGFQAQTDALLEIAAIIVTMTADGPQMGNIALKGIFDRKGLDPSLFGAYDRKGAEGH